MDKEVRELFKKEAEIKRFLAHLADRQEKHMLKLEKEIMENQKWLRQHEVRLTEHWKHISK